MFQQKFKQSRKKIHYSTVRTHVLVEEDLEDPQPSTSRGLKKDAQKDAQQKQTKSRQETRLKSQQKFKHFKKKYIIQQYALTCWLRT